MSQRAWIIVGVVALLLLGACVCTVGAFAFGIRFFSLTPGAAQLSQTVSVELRLDAPAVVTIHNDVGEVTVRGSSSVGMEVRATKRVRSRNSAAAQSLLDRIDVTADSAGNEAEVRVDIPDNLAGESASVDLEILVPRQVALDISTGVGQVSVENTEGGLRIKTGVGEIDVRDVQLLTDSQMDTGVGEIRFEGQLPERGEVIISARTGDVAVRLPDNSQFILDAQTRVGEIDSEFTLANRESGGAEGIVSKTLRGSVGANPDVTLQLRTGTGSITIQR